jgi:SagB-type dehydrogenase family enzyme
LRSPGIKRGRPTAPATLSARLGRGVALEADPGGRLVACFGEFSLDLGTFSAGAVDRAQHLRAGLPLVSLASGRRKSDKELDLLVQQLARHGLLEYRLPGARTDQDAVVIEPQLPDYWPRTPPLRDADALVLSRFAYMRRRGDATVLESPRAGALFRICDPSTVATIAMLVTPRQVKQLRLGKGFPARELLALLIDCQILSRVDTAREAALRAAEDDDDLALWDFHDLLFHARSSEGRHANPIGGVYPHAGAISPLPAVRPRWPGQKIDLRQFSAAHPETVTPVAKLLRERHSTRRFDDQRPIELAELSRLLDGTVRVRSKWKSEGHVGDAGPVVEYALRPYPSAGASYELELYLAVDKCDGLDRGFYHYDADAHALVPIRARAHELEAMLTGARLAMGEPAAPQVLITIAARFGRMSWKYSSLAYALILKDVGVLTQTLYLLATDMGLGGCAIGSVNIDLFARMTGIEFHIEGPVGQFALGRGATSEAFGTHPT